MFLNQSDSAIAIARLRFPDQLTKMTFCFLIFFTPAPAYRNKILSNLSAISWPTTWNGRWVTRKRFCQLFPRDFARQVGNSVQKSGRGKCRATVPHSLSDLLAYLPRR
jgi:hypothetical protein